MCDSAVRSESSEIGFLLSHIIQTVLLARAVSGRQRVFVARTNQNGPVSGFRDVTANVSKLH